VDGSGIVAKKFYSRNDIVNAAYEVWGELWVEKTAVYKQVVRTLRNKNIDPVKTSSGNRKKMYYIDDIVSFVRDDMFDYFRKNSKSEHEHVHAAGSVSDQKLYEIQGQAEDERNRQMQLYDDKDPFIDEDPYSVSECEIEKIFLRKKFEIMIEALFNEKFELQAESLRKDIRDRELYSILGDDEDATKKDIALMERYNDPSSYYKKRISDEK
jgi:hypothetical protein